MLIAQVSLFAQGPDALGAMCFGAIIGIAIGTLIGAVILRTACWLYNVFDGGPRSPQAIPEPDFGKAAGIVLVTMVVNYGVSFVIGFVGGAAALGGGADPRTAQLMVTLISLPISLLVMAAMISMMLPTSFGKAILVALLYLLVAICVAVVIVLVVVGVMMLIR